MVVATPSPRGLPWYTVHELSELTAGAPGRVAAPSNGGLVTAMHVATIIARAQRGAVEQSRTLGPSRAALDVAWIRNVAHAL
jgi:hypothetical protein